jgi:hypothetical protein
MPFELPWRINKRTTADHYHRKSNFSSIANMCCRSFYGSRLGHMGASSLTSLQVRSVCWICFEGRLFLFTRSRGRFMNEEWPDLTRLWIEAIGDLRLVPRISYLCRMVGNGRKF